MSRLVFFLSLILALLLVACGGGEPGRSADATTNEVTRIVETEVTVEVEVTRLVEVVVTATPLPTLEPTATPEIDPAVYVSGSNMTADDLPPGDPDTLGVIVAGSANDFDNVPVVIRNNTPGPFYDLDVSATVTDAAGAVVGTGRSSEVYPHYVPPGGIAYTRINFDDVTLDGNTVAYLVSGRDERGNSQDLEFAQHNPGGEGIVGLLQNSTGFPLEIVEAAVICFDDALTPLDVYDDYTDQERVEVDAQLPFQVGLFGDPCPRYLITANGHPAD